MSTARHPIDRVETSAPTLPSHTWGEGRLKMPWKVLMQAAGDGGLVAHSGPGLSRLFSAGRWHGHPDPADQLEVLLGQKREGSLGGAAGA